MKILKYDKIAFLLSSAKHRVSATDPLTSDSRTPNAWGLNTSLLKTFPDYFRLRFGSTSGNKCSPVSIGYSFHSEGRVGKDCSKGKSTVTVFIKRGRRCLTCYSSSEACENKPCIYVLTYIVSFRHKVHADAVVGWPTEVWFIMCKVVCIAWVLNLH